MEHWKEIPEYEGYYQASNCGRIRSVDRSVKQRGGGCQTKRSRILSPAISRIGYMICGLSKNNKLSSHPVHRLIALAFLGLPKGDKNETNHKDGNKKNNHVDNLEWVTRSENIRHAIKQGLLKVPRGEKHPKSKISDTQRQEIIDLKSKGATLKELSKTYPLSIGHLSKIK